VVENSRYKSCREGSLITDPTIHNNQPDIVLLDETIKETYLIAGAIPDSHNLHNTITERLHKYTEELIRIWQLETVYLTPLVLSTTGIIPNKLHDRFELLNLRPALHIPKQKSVILIIHHTVRKFLARSAWSLNRLKCWETRNVDDDDDDDDDDEDDDDDSR
jgi:hypothetical protein